MTESERRILDKALEVTPEEFTILSSLNEARFGMHSSPEYLVTELPGLDIKVNREQYRLHQIKNILEKLQAKGGLSQKTAERIAQHLGIQNWQELARVVQR